MAAAVEAAMNCTAGADGLALLAEAKASLEQALQELEEVFGEGAGPDA